MASNKGLDFSGTQQAGGTEESLQQNVEAIEEKLIRLSQNINLCNSVLDDLKDLSDVLVRKSLQDASIPSKE